MTLIFPTILQSVCHLQPQEYIPQLARGTMPCHHLQLALLSTTYPKKNQPSMATILVICGCRK